jgi:hypothetical protein
MNKDKLVIPGQVGESKITVIDKQYDWGIYVWKRSNGKWFTDGEGNILNIPSRKGDESQINKLRDAASHFGEPDGSPYFFAGMGRISDEEYSEQVDRMANGLIPNLNDLGAVQAAKDTIAMYGDEE